MIPLADPENIPNPDQISETWAEIQETIEESNKVQKEIHDQTQAEKRNLPIPAEGNTPIAAESHPAEAQKDASVDKKERARFPMPNNRPQPPSKIREEGNVIVAKALAEQLGTSPELKSQMRIDERKMAVLDPRTLAALSHFSYRFVYDEIRYWGHVTEWWLTGSQGIGGLGRRHILQALANTSGIQSVDKAKKPNAIARNLWDRDWKEKAEAQGKVTDE